MFWTNRVYGATAGVDAACRPAPSRLSRAASFFRKLVSDWKADIYRALVQDCSGDPGRCRCEMCRCPRGSRRS